MLRVGGLRKSYGDVHALRGVDLEVQPGEVVSLLGPNGAGKTTLVSIVAGLRKADEGAVEVDGLDARQSSVDVRRRIGLAPQDLGIYPVVTVRNNLQLFGRLAGLGESELRGSIDEVSEALAITDLLDRKAGELSGGQKRRLHTAIALLHRPPLLLLDEATTGADVETRRHILTLVRELAADGAAVLYSTHYLQEVELLDATVALIDQGQVIARGEPSGLIDAHATAVVEMTLDDRVAISDLGPDIVIDGSSVRVPAVDPAKTLADMIPRFPEGSLTSVEIHRPDLEAVYLSLTGRRYDEADEETQDVGTG